MIILSNILIILGCLIILICAIAYSKSSDVFLSVKLAFTSNIYGISLLLLGFALQNFTIILMIKTLIIIVLNIVITIIINHSVIRKAGAEAEII